MTRKVEGFYDLCRERGLTGEHRLVQDRLRGYAEQVREFGYVSHAPALAAGAHHG